MKPKLELSIAVGRPFCPRCGRSMPGRVDADFAGAGRQIVLEHGDRVSWVEVELGEFHLLRQRRPNRRTGGPVNRLGAWPVRGDVVRCPNDRCLARQVVPDLN